MSGSVASHVDEQESSLWDWVSETGRGIWDFNFGQVPNECLDFVIHQFARFGIDFPASVFDVAQAGASCAFYTADVLQPYALFMDTSDVSVTDEWGTTCIELVDPDGGPHTREADPERTETFQYRPGQAEHFFQEALARPGLEALPYSIGHHIDECLDGHHNAEECFDSIDAKTERALKDLCTVHGVFDKKRFFAYFQLSGWAGFLWLAGPYGRDYRYENIILFNTAMEKGECLLIDGTIWSPEYYRKMARPPKSCHLCHQQAWCVELVMSELNTTFICEKCLNPDWPMTSRTTCGTKLCRDSLCKHHPFYGHGREGQFAAATQFGQLGAMARHGNQPRLLGDRGQILRLGF